MSRQRGSADSRSQQHAELQAAVVQLEAWGARTVIAAFVDNSGITRAKLVPSERLVELCSRGVGISKVLDVYTVDDQVSLDGKFITTPVGDLRLVGDTGSLRWLEPVKAAWIAVDQFEQSGEPFFACQRSALKRAVDQASLAGLHMRVGAELEWTLFDLHGHSPAHEGPAYGAQPVIAHAPYLEGVLEAMDCAGLSVEQLHAEYGSGQFELSMAHLEPMKAADGWVLAREVIREVGRKRGYRTSFSPVPLLDGVGNGAHLHISAYRSDSGQNLLTGKGPWSLDPQGAHFLAGVVDSLPSLRLIGAPSPLSPLRLRPQNWAGAYCCWGIENREAAVRLIQQGEGSNAELKLCDSSMNPYLFLAAVIYSGLRGVQEELSLPDPVQVDPAGMDSNIAPIRLPSSISEAIRVLEDDEDLQSDLGSGLTDTFLAVRRREATELGQLDSEELVALLRWRY